jgi:hypothetical protein
MMNLFGKNRTNRRSNERETYFRRGRIIIPQYDISLYITVLNYTEHGAMIKQIVRSKLPKSFHLEVYDSSLLLPLHRVCFLRWQKGNVIGIEFQNTPDKLQKEIPTRLDPGNPLCNSSFSETMRSHAPSRKHRTTVFEFWAGTDREGQP